MPRPGPPCAVPGCSRRCPAGPRHGQGPGAATAARAPLGFNATNPEFPTAPGTTARRRDPCLPGLSHPGPALARGCRRPSAPQAPVSGPCGTMPPSFHPPVPAPPAHHGRGGPGAALGRALLSAHLMAGGGPAGHPRPCTGESPPAAQPRAPESCRHPAPGPPQAAGRGAPGRRAGRREDGRERRAARPARCGAGVGAGATPGASRARPALPPEALTGARSQSEPGSGSAHAQITAERCPSPSWRRARRCAGL